jgi:hypothetical protein
MKTNKSCITISYMKNWNNNTSKRTSKKSPSIISLLKKKPLHITPKEFEKNTERIIAKKNQLQNFLA